jgi:Asp-tRNA(Asn)/Glu-tRNA(Gln) amidotransferase A subunit family amidase
MSTELHDLSIAGLSALIAARKLSPVELVDALIRRVEEYDGQTHAFITRTFDLARQQARAAEAEIAAGRYRGALHGIPFALKDIYDTRGILTSGHSRVFIDRVPSKDATTTMKLYDAGAVLLGKLATHEMAHAGPSFDLPWPPARNPWSLAHFTGGSSTGSGAAVAAGMVPVALGSDTGGSIRGPASHCGVVGLMPTFGLVGRAGVITNSYTFDHCGPLTRTVEDAARLTDVMKDGGPSFTEAARTAPGKLRIAVSVGLPPLAVQADAEQLGGVHSTAALLRELGHEVVEREFDWGLTLGNRVLARFVRGVGDMALEIGHRGRLSRRARGIARIGMMIPGRVADAAGEQAAADAERLNRIFDESDVVLTPMFTRRPLRVREYDGRPGLWTLAGNVRFAPYGAAFNHTGQPAVAVPAGFAGDGFPIGVQLVGPPDSEARLISLSSQLEQARDWPAHRPAVAA